MAQRTRVLVTNQCKVLQSVKNCERSVTTPFHLRIPPIFWGSEAVDKNRVGSSRRGCVTSLPIVFLSSSAVLDPFPNVFQLMKQSMMSLPAIALAIGLGLAVPVIESAIAPTVVLAQSLPTGTFSDGEWTVRIAYQGNALTYYGRNENSGDSLFLSGASVGGNASRRTYTWNNSGHRYRVSWQPSDPDTIRVEVFSPNGRSILNRLLYR